MDIWKETMTKAEQGVPCFINLKKRILKVGRKTFVNGSYDGELPNITIENLDDIYRQYKHSVPTSRNESYYFSALKYEDLSDNDMLCGMRRDVAKTQLELAVLILALKGWTFDGYFWQSSKHKKFIILKEWIA